jgi:hypothetical protein
MLRPQQFLCGLFFTVVVVSAEACSDSEAPIARPTFANVQGVWITDYRRVVSQETTPQVFDSRSFPTCSASVPPPCTVNPYYFTLDSVNQGQYTFATTPPSDPSYVPLLAGTAAVVNDSLLLGATTIGCCRAAATYALQVYSSRMHLFRHWTLGGADARPLGLTLPSGSSTLEATEEWWFRR